MRQDRKMPKRNSIIRFWKPFFKERGIDIKNQCFACLFPIFLERSHIISKTYGGSDMPENIHLLCKFCHLESEFLDNKNDYFKWLFSKSKDNSLSWKFIANVSKLDSFIGLPDLEIISKINTIKSERVKKKLNERLKKTGEWRTGRRKDGTFVLNDKIRALGTNMIKEKAKNNENNIKTIGIIKTMISNGEFKKLSLRSLAKKLNDAGFKNSKGNPLTPQYIHYIKTKILSQEQN